MTQEDANWGSERIDKGMKELAERSGERHPDLLFTLLTVAEACGRNGDHEDAVRYYRQAIPLHRELNGSRHPKLGESLVAMASALDALNMYDEEITVLEEALEIRRDGVGDDRSRLPDVVSLLNRIGNCHFRCGSIDEARERYTEAVSVVESDDDGRSAPRSKRSEKTKLLFRKLRHFACVVGQ